MAAVFQYHKLPYPFFIVGAPRTGSTLLRRLLNNHSQIAIPPESGFLAEYLLADHVSLEKRKQVFANEPEFEYWGVRPEWEDIKDFDMMIQCIDHIHQVYAKKDNKPFWGQKTPKLVRTGKLWLDQLPNSRIIHMVRDPRAVANSLRASKYHNLHIIHGTSRYVNDTLLGIALERYSPDRVLRISYEGLVEQPEQTLRTICEFTQHQYDSGMLANEPQMNLTPNEMKFGHHKNVSGQMDRSFTEKWKKILTEREIQVIESIAQEVMNQLGYPLMTSPSEPTSTELIQAKTHHFRHTVVHAFKELTQRPDFWQIARRRWQLGNIQKMLRDHSKGM